MKATMMHAAGNVRVDDIPDAQIVAPTDVVMTVTHACICGSDLWPYRGYEEFPEGGRRMGHEALGVVAAVGSEVSNLKVGDTVAMPFAYSDGTCIHCQIDVHTSCVQGGFFGFNDPGGAQAEALRIPQADGTLVIIPDDLDKSMMASILTLTDVMGTGHHAAVSARVEPGKTVAVVGDGAVGLCAVIAAKRLGAEQIILMGRHTNRTELGKEFGATDVVSERGKEAVERVKELTSGYGVQSVLECVGTNPAMDTAFQITRPGGAIGRVGVPHDVTIPAGVPTFLHNLTISGGPAPTRAYFAELLEDVLDGSINPGRVFDVSIGLDDVPDGYQAMDNREAIKVMVEL